MVWLQSCLGLAAYLLSLSSTAAAIQHRPHQLKTRAIYPDNWLQVPVDHIHNDTIYEPHSNETFNLRYFFDDQYYREGGPVIVLSGAEGNAEGSLVFLQKGIIKILAEATGGLGVVLEHRYYGKSFPVPNLSTDNFRFLSSDQAMADMAYFSKNVVFPGHEGKNLTAPTTPYIWYGGSYAGALVALYRKLYPDVAWGAISSSSPLAPISDYWEYYEITRKYAAADCTDIQGKLVSVIDNVLIGNDADTKSSLKRAFGLEDILDDANFVTVVTGGRGQWQSMVSLTALGIGSWQSRYWDPKYYNGAFEIYCSNITSPTILYPETARLAPAVEDLIKKGGWGCQTASLLNPMLNLIGWVNETAVSKCTQSPNMCFSQWTNSSAAFYTDRSFANTALGWPYQYCTQWGCLPSGSLPNPSPSHRPLVSRLITDDYNRLICKHAFNITTTPDVNHITQFGGHNFTYPRLAHVNGEADNWRPLSPLAVLADGTPTALNITSTLSEPRIVVKDGVHGWEMFGAWANETTADFPPQGVRDTQAELRRVVLAWMEEWTRQNDTCS